VLAGAASSWGGSALVLGIAIVWIASGLLLGLFPKRPAEPPAEPPAA
jgi:hypothetical protein